jgi:outer membrane biogenesis lipoprotein LolB
MSSLKTAIFIALALASLTACSSTFNAAPVQSSKAYQDEQSRLRLDPDVVYHDHGW